jgi:hypothetical protein
MIEEIERLTRLLDQQSITLAESRLLRNLRAALEEIRSLRNNPMAG